MGDWRRVQIIGTCSEEDVPRLRDAMALDTEHYKNFHCLSNAGGLAGLPDWAATSFDVVGNLAERNYDVAAVAKQIELLAWAAPSLNVTVHVGEAFEESTCVATIICKDKEVEVIRPRIENVPPIPEDQIAGRLFAALRKSIVRVPYE